MKELCILVLTTLLVAALTAPCAAREAEPKNLRRVVAVENVCAWPNLTLMRDGTVIAIFHNQPAHGTMEGDVDCWASRDGLKWEKRSTVTRHEPQTIRMNHAAGLARNGDLIVLCSGWTDVKQPARPKQPPFRDAVLRAWVLRSADGGRTWEKRDAFPAPEPGWTEHIPFGDIWAGEDGALHTSCYQGELSEPTKSFKTKSHRSWHFRSDDDGWTWRPVSVIGPRHNETDVFPLGGKSWLAAARVDRMELIRSDDNGATWQTPQPVTEKGEINGHLNRLKDGRLLFSYGVRVKGRRGVCAKLSSDDGRTWSEPLRLAHTVGEADCGYPSSVQLASGAIVTAWYSKESPEHAGYHMGVTVWEAPSATQAGVGQPVQPAEFQHARITDAWQVYAKTLTFGKGQTLALVDDGCKLDKPEWTASVDGVPKVRVAYDAVDGDDNPKHEGRGYHGSTIGIPSSLNYGGKWGVAYNNQIAVIRGLECCHGKITDSRTLAAALQWILDNHEKHHITTVNLAPVDDQAHAEPVATEIDGKLAELRRRGIWVSAPAGNHNFINGISWPACQPDCFAIGAVKPGKDEVYLDRHEKVVLLVPARATSSSNAIACGAAMLLREAIEKSGYDWKADGKNLPEAMMAIMQKTGQPVDDPATKRVFRRLDVQAALEHVFGHAKSGHSHAGDSRIEILHRSSVFQHTGTDSKDPSNTTGFNHAPSVVLLPDGRLMTAWYSAPFEGSPKQKIVSAFSNDQGRTWSAAAMLQDFEGRADFDPAFVAAGKQTFLFFSATNPLRIYFRASDDAGRSWSPPREAPVETNHTSRSNGIRLSTGELLVPLHRTGTRAGGVLKSKDGGKTWTRFGSVANPDGQGGEPTIAELKSGRVMMFLRTKDGELWRSFSADKGATWSAPEKTSLPATSSSHNLFRTRDGTLVLTHNPSKPPHRLPLTMRVSKDDGVTWGEPTVIADRPAQVSGWQVSYPSVAELPDGTLMVVWTQIKSSPGELYGDIQSARVALKPAVSK